MLSFQTVHASQLIGATVAFNFKGDPVAVEVWSIKFARVSSYEGVRVRVVTPKGKYYWVPLETPINVIKGADHGSR